LGIGLLSAILLAASGCAYYNYLYDARKSYKEGERQQQEGQEQGVTGGKKGLSAYDKCIESAGRMLQYYPNSRWEDDALLLLAKAYYRTGKFRNAVGKVDELIVKYPNSKYVSEGLLWKGMSLLKVAQRDSARAILGGLLTTDTPAEWRKQAQFALAEDYYEQQDWESALATYNLVFTESEPEDWLHNQAGLKVGECFVKLERLDEAVGHYGRILAGKPNRAVILEATIAWCKALRRLGRYEEALAALKKLLDDAAFVDDFPRINLEIAVTQREMGQNDEARHRLEDITKSDVRGDPLIRAQFELGSLLWAEWRDFKAARTALQEAVRLGRATEYGAKADSLLRDTEQLETRWLRIGFLELQITMADSAHLGLRQLLPGDTMYVDSLSLLKTEEQKKSNTGKGFGKDKLRKSGREKKPAVETPTDSLKAAAPDSLTPLDSSAVAALLMRRTSELREARLDLAGYHLFSRSDADSARHYFETVTPSDSADALWGRAIAALAYIAKLSGDTARSDSLHRLIALRMPDSPLGMGVRQLLGLPVNIGNQDSLTIYLKAAEAAWLEVGDLSLGKDLYLAAAAALDSGSDVRARALLGAAYISHRLPGGDSLALALYNEVGDKFKRTDYGNLAKRRAQNIKSGGVGEFDRLVERGGAGEEQPPGLEAPLSPEEAPEIGGQGRIFSPEEVDELPQMVTSKLQLDNFIRSYYPFQAFSDGLDGKVMLELVVSETGAVTEPAIVSSEPEGAGFEDAAIKVIAKLHYRAGRLKGVPVPVKIKQEIQFRQESSE
jgi:TonB family protein